MTPEVQSRRWTSESCSFFQPPTADVTVDCRNLVQKYLFVSWRFQNGYTPLHIAAIRNQLNIATVLLTYGSKPNAQTLVRSFKLSLFLSFFLSFFFFPSFFLSFFLSISRSYRVQLTLTEYNWHRQSSTSRSHWVQLNLTKRHRQSSTSRSY